MGILGDYILKSFEYKIDIEQNLFQLSENYICLCLTAIGWVIEN